MSFNYINTERDIHGLQVLISKFFNKDPLTDIAMLNVTLLSCDGAMNPL